MTFILFGGPNGPGNTPSKVTFVARLQGAALCPMSINFRGRGRTAPVGAAEGSRGVRPLRPNPRYGATPIAPWKGAGPSSGALPGRNRVRRCTGGSASLAPGYRPMPFQGIRRRKLSDIRLYAAPSRGFRRSGHLPAAGRSRHRRASRAFSWSPGAVQYAGLPLPLGERGRRLRTVTIVPAPGRESR